MKKRIFSIVIFSFVFNFALFSLPNRACDVLQNLLSQNSIPYSVQTLSNANSQDFPYSLVIEKSPVSADSSGEKDVLVIITQKDAIKMQNEILSLCSFVQKNEFPFKIEILLSANDFSTIPKTEINKIIPGTQTFIESHENTENLIAIAVSDFEKSEKPDSKKVKISYTCKGRATNPDLMKNLISCFQKASVDFSINNAVLGFERLGCTKVNPILEYLLQNEIPSVNLSFQKESFEVLKVFLQNFSQFQNEISNETWDSQYFFLTIFSHSIFIGQKILFIILCIDILISLFLLCFSNFVGKNAIEHKEELKRTIYLPVVIIALVLVSLFVSQLLTKLFVPSWLDFPILAFFVKVILATCIYEILAKFRFFIKLPQANYIWGFFVNLTSFFNLLIFSLEDLSFLPFFTLIYVFENLSRLKEKKAWQIVFFALSISILIPFLICDVKILEQICSYYTNARFLDNLNLSLFVLPVIFMKLRYSISAGRYQNCPKTEYKVLLKKALPVVIVFASFCVISAISNPIAKKIHPVKPKVSVYSESKTDSVLFSTKITQNLEQKDYSIKILAKPNVIRYIVKVESDSLLPIFNANYPFDAFTEKDCVIFYFEENPSESLELKFSSKKDKKLNFEITSYEFDSSGEILKVVQILETKEK